MTLSDDIKAMLNANSRENESNTPDFILASYMLKCLIAFEEATCSRDNWYGIAPEPGNPHRVTTPKL
jgi:hypothetical protein